jgi:hypothetical protein
MPGPQATPGPNDPASAFGRRSGSGFRSGFATRSVVLNHEGALTLTNGDPIVIPWSAAFVDSLSFDPLAVLPSELGLDIALDGINGDITPTVDGIWWLSLAFNVERDETALARSGFTNLDISDAYLTDVTAASWTTTAPKLTYGQMLAVPAGGTFQAFAQADGATANPYKTLAFQELIIVRVA